MSDGLLKRCWFLAIALFWSSAAFISGASARHVSSEIGQRGSQSTATEAQWEIGDPPVESGNSSSAGRILTPPGLSEPLEIHQPLEPRTLRQREQIRVRRAYTVARALQDQKRWEEAIAVLEPLVDAELASAAIFEQLSQLNFVLGRIDQGLSYAERVLDLDPNEAQIIQQVQGLYERRQQFPKLESLLKEVLNNPRLEEQGAGAILTRNELGKLYGLRLNRLEEAADQFAQVLQALDRKEALNLAPADLNRILGQRPEQTYRLYSLIFYQIGRFELAVRSTRRALAYESEDEGLLDLLVSSLLGAERSGEALRLTERRLSQGVRSLAIYRHLVEALEAEGRSEREILERLEREQEDRQARIPVNLLRVELYREVGEQEQARELLEELLDSELVLDEVLTLATELLRLKLVAPWLELVGENLSQIRADRVGQTVLGRQIVQIGGDLSLAEALVDSTAERIDAEDPIQVEGSLLALYLQIVQSLLLSEQYDPARELVRLLPNLRSARLLLQLAVGYYLSGQPEQAYELAQEARSVADPREFNTTRQALQIACEALLELDRSDEAIAMGREALMASPENLELNQLVGSLLDRSGRDEECEQFYRELLERAPDEDELVKIARLGLSILYVDQGEIERGLSELEILRERLPEDANVNNDLGYLLAEQGIRLKEAEQMVRLAVEEEPDNAAYLDSLGWVLYKRGRYQEALEPLRKAVDQLERSDPTILDHLGEVYFQLGRIEEARQLWKQALEDSEARGQSDERRLPEIRKKLEALDQAGENQPRKPTDDNP